MKLPALLTALGLLVLASCSDDSGSSSGPSEDDLEANVTAYAEAFAEGDTDAAVELLTDRCRREDRDEIEALVRSFGDSDYPDLEFVSYSADVSGTTATVNYETDPNPLSQDDEQWLVEDGAWKNDDC